jgi:serine/threonine protein kinase
MDFEIGKRLGHGKYGNVYLTRNKKSKRKYALKVCLKKNLNKRDINLIVNNEIAIHKNIKHPRIIRMYDYSIDDERICLFLEYAAKGDLYKLLKKEKFLSESKVASYVYDISLALKYLHSKFILHRDIKPENVLLNSKGHPKLCDFGFAIYCKNSKKMRVLGTLDYLAPEIVESKPYGLKVDIWCLGVLTYELIGGIPPFYNSGYLKTYNSISNVDYKFPTFFGDNCKNFIDNLLRYNPENRMSFDEILNHDWIKENKKFN